MGVLVIFMMECVSARVSDAKIANLRQKEGSRLYVFSRKMNATNTPRDHFMLPKWEIERCENEPLLPKIWSGILVRTV